MVRDTPLGFPSHTLPYRFRDFTTLSAVLRAALSGRLFSCKKAFAAFAAGAFLRGGASGGKKHIIKLSEKLIDISGYSYYIVSVKF